jgi:hypothetical protein
LKQTFTDFEWVLVDALYDVRRAAVRRFVENVPLIHLPEPQKRAENVWNLCAAYNEGIRRCSGEYILSYQDYIWLPGTGIEKLLDLADDRTAVIGVGHKAEKPDKAVNPRGLITIFEEPYSDRPKGISELDTRIDGRQEVVETNYSFFELNYAIAPRRFYWDAGGLPEEFDKGYGADNIGLSLKAHLMGYGFLLDKTNECVGFNQSLFPRPYDWERRHNNKGFFAEWAQRALAGEPFARYL